ncbi:MULTISPECIES: type II toxin-antitoxin system RatA family toxin [unclassified Minwuia]|jgi:coenzyme Q-binding protein COQ10|uniref:type II toxin-antitoxin system RatA family toxin n=1 Tax=unclassified Minwuia TaxID=2618799 RepID=UPI00247940FD|nr:MULTISPECIES: type II toxin-antitoxin system RatA family toxin [unclassified Minwuia]
MPKHSETRVLPHTPEQMYSLVADIGRYPEFLPWCVGARIVRQSEHEVLADLLIGFKVFRERFRSKVDLDPATLTIDVAYVEGPMRYLENHWHFRPHPDGCEIDFKVDFEFRSLLLRKAIEPLFHEAVRRMVAAFEKRAAALYG